MKANFICIRAKEVANVRHGRQNCQAQPSAELQEQRGLTEVFKDVIAKAIEGEMGEEEALLMEE